MDAQAPVNVVQENSSSSEDDLTLGDNEYSGELSTEENGPVPKTPQELGEAERVEGLRSSVDLGNLERVFEVARKQLRDIRTPSQREGSSNDSVQVGFSLPKFSISNLLISGPDRDLRGLYDMDGEVGQGQVWAQDGRPQLVSHGV